LNGTLNSIAAIRFYYPGRDRRFETLPFYLKRIRGFLKRNRGKACWLMGGVIERPAYLLFKKDLAGEVAQLIKEELSEGGKFEMEKVKDPTSIVMKYAKNERYVIGYLELPEINIKLGSEETLTSERERKILEQTRKGFMLKDGYTFIRAEDAELKTAPRRDPQSGETEHAPILILKNATVSTVKNGRIIADEHEPTYAVWLSLIETPKTTR
jgi:hypothetical protein